MVSADATSGGAAGWLIPGSPSHRKPLVITGFLSEGNNLSEHIFMPRGGRQASSASYVLTKEDLGVPRWSCRCPRESRAAFPWPHRDRDGRVLWSRARPGDA